MLRDEEVLFPFVPPPFPRPLPGPPIRSILLAESGKELGKRRKWRGGEEADLDWTPFFGNFIQVDPLKQQLHIIWAVYFFVVTTVGKRTVNNKKKEVKLRCLPSK